MSGVQLLLNFKSKQTLNDSFFFNNNNINGLLALHIPSSKHDFKFYTLNKNSKICMGEEPKKKSDFF